MRLHINIDHVATLRNQRDTAYPDVLTAAELALSAGADGITVHLREDRRHIRDDDVKRLRSALSAFPRPVILNLEMAATRDMAAIARGIRPHVVTLVPERREQRTTEGGLQVVSAGPLLAEVIQSCLDAGILVSLFIEASEEAVRAAHSLGARQVEFHTGHYCDAEATERALQLPRFAAACRLAHELGLEVAAGHGLNTDNVGPIAALPHMAELNIGHSVICEAVFLGLPEAVRRLRQAILAGTSGT